MNTHSSSFTNKEDRRRLRQCNYTILKMFINNTSLCKRARDFNTNHITLLIQTACKMKL